MLLVTGSSGQLGRALVKACEKEAIACKGLSRASFDIFRRDDFKALRRNNTITCIINCAAFTDVEAAEKAENRRALYLANVEAVRRLGLTGRPVIHISTNYVFGGENALAYEAEDFRSPVNRYGLSKAIGEDALRDAGCPGIILRTAALYSKDEGTKNFYQTIRRLAQTRDRLEVVADQCISPTRTDDLAQAVLQLIRQGEHLKPMHRMHFTNSGGCSWHAFASAIVQLAGARTHVDPISSAQYVCLAKRPTNGILSLKTLQPCGITPRHWLEALTDD